MPRGTRNPSQVFAAVIEQAKARLEIEAKGAEAFQHKGVRGDERVAPLSTFLQRRLPDRFAVAEGEAIDFQDSRTGQLDLIVYDAHASAAVSEGGKNLLIPAEALYAVLEVKTTLTQIELNKCYSHAAKVRRLKPFKKPFVAPRAGGSPIGHGESRCLYVIFSYFTDLGSSNWLGKEYARIESAASLANCSVAAVDRLLVLSEGIILPDAAKGKAEQESPVSTFLEFYLHLANFINRESRRRPPVDWQVYSSRTSKGWINLSKGA